MAPSGIEEETFRFVAQHLNHCATAVPLPILVPDNYYILNPSISDGENVSVAVLVFVLVVLDKGVMVVVVLGIVLVLVMGIW